ncbi:beta-glucosidase [Novosphingobium terrae]|uniref:beta-glucosidase n=1 Tax=Novosphingobium terrae TaxID=2726189 RepID=UPI001980FBA7|nr:glycoside hydrolase family 3 C-terminal domain-containing protein [Novosphingobium terrae]
MVKSILPAAAMLLASGLSSSLSAQTATPQSPVDARTDALIAKMTRDEKLTLVFGLFGTDDASRNHYARPPLALDGSAGFVPGIPRLGIPPQWQTDAGVGVATQGAAKEKRLRSSLPAGIATAASWDPDMARKGGAMIGDEAKRSGFNVMLAGGVDLLREPRNGRGFEYGGEDPLLAGVMVGEQIAGIQSNGVIATIKHYALNDQETERNGTSNVLIDHSAARMSDLLAFQFGIEHGAPGSVMCSYNKVDGVRACENPFLLTQVLRHDWKWPGFVMSDWGATHSTVQAAQAGLDQESGYPFDDAPYFAEPLKKAVAAGQVSEARLTQMARRVVRAMVANGLLDKPTSDQSATIDYAAHAQVTRADAEAGAVLLQNRHSLLPLGPNIRSIAIIGGHADKGVLAGGGSSAVYPRGGNAVPGLTPTSWPGPVIYDPSSPLEAIRKLAPNATIHFADGTDPAQAAALAKSSDVALVFGTQWAGEGFDVNLTLDGDQDALIQSVAAAQPKTVVVLESGGPVLTPWRDQVGAILEAWYPGTAGGEAIANLLFGVANPSGHLPVTFPADLGQLPHHEAPHGGDVTYTEGATVGYKWFEAKGLKPAFPFGHGLSYTSFTASGLQVAREGAGVIAHVRVTNTGQRRGAAVPQIYVAAAPAAGWEAPKRLGGWQKVTLEPGQSREVSVAIDPRLLARWDEANHRWRIAAGSYTISLAQSATEPGESSTIVLPEQTLPVDWHPGGAEKKR